MAQQRSIPILPFLTFLLSLAAVVLCASCSGNPNASATTCESCHTAALDDAHQMACTACHKGNDQAKTKDIAHAGLLARPAHPDNLSASCGSCHAAETAELPRSLHYTLRNFVNRIRSAFGAKLPLASLTDIPVREEPTDVLQLADDLLRRRCLSCHLFTPGDDYGATAHGTGCAACHLEYNNGKLTDHRFKAYSDDQLCLSCHYGNRVGSDYYGRFEHDFNTEYRTPYTTAETTQRPYGVEYHQLAPDIHQQRGLVCIDCHGKNELMAAEQQAGKVTCADCHDPARLENNLPPGVERAVDGYFFVSKRAGERHKLPLLHHPAHSTNSSISCQACHAQWSYNDSQTHLLRSDLDEYDDWALLTVQGSSEIERLLEHNLDYSNTEVPPAMTDKISGETRRGVWYKGYTRRRWETVTLGRTPDGKVAVLRPQLNLVLSWVNEDGTVRFDGHPAAAPNGGMTPYTPHTTGPAGLFYDQRLRDFYRTEKSGHR